MSQYINNAAQRVLIGFVVKFKNTNSSVLVRANDFFTTQVDVLWLMRELV